MPDLEEYRQFQSLLAPGRIGSMELKNRIVMCPMGDNQATADGFITEQQMAYFETRARGGAALVLMGSVGIAFPEGGISPFQASIADDDHIDGLAKLADRVHAHGCRLAAQLSHGGKTSARASAAGVPMIVPSMPKDVDGDPLMAILTADEIRGMSWSAGGRVEFREMTGKDIGRVVDDYAAAAVRARQAGLDGVELHAGHGYLIDQFLSPTSNFRTDSYGGPVDNRARFLVEVLAGIRARVGPDYPVWCRINGTEFFTEGETLPDALEVAKLAEQAGADALHVSAYAAANLGIGYTEAHTTHTPGRFLQLAAAVKAAVGIPVIAVGRIDPDLADRLIADGTADFVAMGRKLLADPELPNKLRSGNAEDIRPCIYHYRCISQIFVGESVRCASNPSTGREVELRGHKAVTPRRVLVVGGGPAGMEAARLAALDGHAVTLVDSGDELGGRLTLAALTYQPHAELLGWLRRQVRKAPIEVRSACTMTTAEIAAHGADVVILATGGKWERPSVPGAQLPNVYTVDQLGRFLTGTGLGGLRRVVVVGGDRVGIGLAKVAADRGIGVTVLESTDVFCLQAGLPLRWRLLHEVQAAGAELVPHASLLEITSDSVAWSDEGGTLHHDPADAVFVAAPVIPDRSLAEQLAAADVSVHAIGDCEATNSALLEGAMLSAARIAITI